jgi:hypothetical protein
MIYDTSDLLLPLAPSGAVPATLSIKPPFLWPDTRYLAKHATYPDMPPMSEVVRDAELISGVLVDATEGTLAWLEDLLCRNPGRRIRLVVVISPACPTREEHLRAFLKLSEAHRTEKGGPLDVRILAMSAHYGEDCRHAVLPPTTIQAHDSKNGETWTCIGSVGDSGYGPVFTGSLNLVFRSDPALRNAWRKWFQYLQGSAARLTEETCRIPHLVPPQGTEEAALAWAEFMATCAQSGNEESASPTIDPETGEVNADAEGNPPDPWDGGETALDPLADKFQEIYSAGSLVSVNELTRIKPLEIPVKAALLGQSSVKTVGALTQKQSFTLMIFDEHICKEIDKCRKIADLVEVLTFPLSLGNRWLPNAAKPLLERELEARNERGLKTLVEALGGKAESLAANAGGSDEQKNVRQEQIKALVADFIARKREVILADLNQMYRDLKRGEAVPDDKAKEVLDEFEKRLSAALGARVTPTCTYNNLAPPDLSPTAPDDNWIQPLSLLAEAARKFREQLADPFYFDRKFSGKAFTKEEFLQTCNVFEDRIVAVPDYDRAKAEILQIKEIMDGESTPKEKCQAVWKLVSFSNSSNATKP